MTHELNEEIDIKDETIEHDFGQLTSEIDIKSETLQDIDSNGTLGQCSTLSANTTDVDPVDIVEEVTTTSLLTKPGVDISLSCEKCHEEFSSLLCLQSHKRIKHPVVLEKPTCSICNATFTSQSSLDVHLLIHAGIKPFSCVLCPEKYRTKTHLKRHILKQHKSVDEKSVANFLPAIKKLPTSYNCGACDITYKSLAGLDYHIESFHRKLKPFKCSICGACFTTKNSLTSHMTIHSGERPVYTCTLCMQGGNFKNFSWKRGLKRHMIREHKLEGIKINIPSILPHVVTDKKDHTCILCNKIFNSLDKLKRHERFHTNIKRFQCTICQDLFRRKAELKIHMIKSHKFVNESLVALPLTLRSYKNFELFVCKICHIGYTTHTALKNHQESLHKALKPLKDTVCKSSLTQINLTSHSTVHGERPFKCEKCNEEFNSLDSLKQHELKIHVKPTFTSSTSNSTFTSSTSDSMFAHLYRMCTDPKPFQCDWCGRPFAKRSHVTSHVKRMHMTFDKSSGKKVLPPLKPTNCTKNIKPIKTKEHFICKICNNTYTSNHGLKFHMQIFHQVHQLKFKCNECNASFNIKKILKKHFMSDYSQQGYTCGVCGLVFKFQNCLTLHLKVHNRTKTPIPDVSDQKDQNCETLNKEISSCGSSLKHVQIINENVGVQSSTSQVTCTQKSSLKPRVKSGKTHAQNFVNKRSMAYLLPAPQIKANTPYFCELCHIIYKSSASLKLHIQSIHLGLTPYKCTLCTAAYTRKESLIKHLTIHSGINTWKCEFCSIVFRYDQSLQRHMTKVHAMSTTVPKPPSQKIESSKRKHVNPDLDCSTCQKSHLNDIEERNKKLKIDQRGENLGQNSGPNQQENTFPRSVFFKPGFQNVQTPSSQLQQSVEEMKVSQPVCKSPDNNREGIWITKVKPCCVLLDRGEVTRYLARLDKREEETVGSSPIEDPPLHFTTPPVRVYPSHPCGRVRVTSDRHLSAATSNVGLVCNNIGPRAIVEPKQLCVVNSGDAQLNSHLVSENLSSECERFEKFEEMYIKTEPIVLEMNDIVDPLSSGCVVSDKQTSNNLNKEPSVNGASPSNVQDHGDKPGRTSSSNSSFNLPCLICGVYCPTAAELELHIKKAHNICKVCDVSFTSCEQLGYHENRHKLGQINHYLCLECGVIFKLKNKLEIHFKKVHKKEKYTCKNYFTYSVKETSFKVVNNKGNKALCFYCHSVFNNIFVHEEHLKKAHKLHCCSCCSKYFTGQVKFSGNFNSKCHSCQSKMPECSNLD